MADSAMQKAIDDAYANGKPVYVIVPDDGAYIFDGTKTTKVPTPPSTSTPTTPTTPTGKVFRVIDYNSIYDALTAAAASGGTVVFPANGQFTIDLNKPLSVAKNVSIQGNGTTIKLVGSGFAAEMLGIRGSNVNIDKLILDGNNLSKCGVNIYENLSNINITNSTIMNYTQGGSYATDLVSGVMIKTGVVNVVLSGNTVKNVRAKNAPAVSRGIMMSSYNGNIAQNVTISNNTITDIYPKDDGDGIYFDSGTVLTNSVVTGNTFERCAKRGIKIASPGVTVSNNHIINSFLNNNQYVASDPAPNIDMFAGISVYANDVTVTGNTIDGVGSFYGGIELSAETTVQRVKILNNSVTMGASANLSGTTGIRVGDISDFEIRANKIVHASIGIWTWQGAVNGVIADNDISDVDYGIQLSTYVTGKPFSNVTLSNNKIQARKTAIVNR
ncbi:right-handed parallel beta-helix repeat-containing protein [Paenibacillus aestuarii]|uniref:Right-handed parallel beta-helix repeat-containing protein n=1 Tax=Paenibacillus aestuarii TaxID=516965 RepID=A0ABW0K226_9BACL|nr:right-handed parallel beta-helix repeat-containing protein [Paenibacillus aestuarii]